MKVDKLYLIHLSESIAKIESYMDGLDFAAFMQKTPWCRMRCSVICRYSPNRPSVFPRISRCTIPQLNGTRSPACGMSWSMIISVLILRQYGPVKLKTY